MKRKVCLVTGSSKGIGAATVCKFASQGYNVVINYVDSKDKAIALKGMIVQKYDVDVLIIKCDVSNEKDVKKMINKVIDTFEQINVVVNNAGIAIDSLVDDKQVSDFEHILKVNLIGAFLVSREAAKYMKDGVIINVASTNGIDTPYQYGLDYDASKAGLISLTKNLANYYAPNIRVNAVAPGWVITDHNQNLDEEFINTEKAKILLERFAKPEEIANVIAFLASSEASYINGEVIRIDGGLKC